MEYGVFFRDSGPASEVFFLFPPPELVKSLQTNLSLSVEEDMTMDASKVEERVIKIIRRELDVDSSQEVAMATTLEELDFDSLNMMDVVLEVEQEYSIRVSEDEVEFFLFVGDLVRYVQKKINERERAVS
jgi:acyl carrier protein